MSIPTHGVGVNFTVNSYIDHLDFGLTCDAASVPDVDRLGDLLVESFDELRSVVYDEKYSAISGRFSVTIDSI